MERPFADSDPESVDWLRRPGGGYEASHFANGYSAHLAVFWTGTGGAELRHVTCEIKVYADESALRSQQPSGDPVWEKSLLCVGSLRTYQPMVARWMKEFEPA